MASPYSQIVDLVRQLDINDDGILMNQKIKSIEHIFCTTVLDGNMLNEILEYLNDVVLKDPDDDIAEKFAMLVTSRNFDFFSLGNTTVRYKMISLLQRNYLKADVYREISTTMLYNSITLLGEYYNRIRQTDGSPMTNLGAALLDLLTIEISNEDSNGPENIDLKLAKLILSQITLNGRLFQNYHKNEVNNLLYHIRRVLIELQNLKTGVKALLLMALDLFYNNFCTLGLKLENMYTKYLINVKNFTSDESYLAIDSNKSELDNTESNVESNVESTEEKTPTDENNGKIRVIYEKKWSEQVFEESSNELLANGVNYSQLNLSDSEENENENLFYNNDDNADNYDDDDERQSVHSEGGSLRLYNVKDRLKNAQKTNQQQRPSSANWNGRYHPLDRNRVNTRNSSANSSNNYNNDRNSNRDSRNHGNKFNTYNNRLQYDRPPRFSKFSQQYQQQSRNHNDSQHLRNQQQQQHTQHYRQSRQNNTWHDQNNRNSNNLVQRQNLRDNRLEQNRRTPEFNNRKESEINTRRNESSSRRNFNNSRFVPSRNNSRQRHRSSDQETSCSLLRHEAFIRDNCNNLEITERTDDGDVNNVSNNTSQHNRNNSNHRQSIGNRSSAGGAGTPKAFHYTRSFKLGSQNSLASETTGTWERRGRRGFSTKKQ